MHTIGITGGTGFIGSHIIPLLSAQGYNIIVFTRSAGKKGNGNTYAHWDPDKNQCDTAAVAQLDAVIHLAGAGVAEKRLTAQRKKEIVDSRVKGTRFLLDQLKRHAPNCKALVAASATGYYGPDRGGQPFTEDALPYDDFLGDTCRQWEQAVMEASSFLRIAIIRIGIVLGKEGGAYKELARPLSFGMMPILGGGRQMVSWINVDDLAREFIFLLEHSELSGVYNGVAPNPATHSELMHTIAEVKGGLKIPVPVPAFALKLALGEMSTEVLKSCTVSDKKIRSAGFTFNDTTIASAVRRIEGK